MTSAEHTRIYQREYMARRRAAERATRPPTTRERTLRVLARGPRTAEQLVRSLGLSHQLVGYHLRRLVAAGLVTVERGSKQGKGRSLAQYRRVK